MVVVAVIAAVVDDLPSYALIFNWILGSAIVRSLPDGPIIQQGT